MASLLDHEVKITVRATDRRAGDGAKRKWEVGVTRSDGKHSQYSSIAVMAESAEEAIKLAKKALPALLKGSGYMTTGTAKATDTRKTRLHRALDAALDRRMAKDALPLVKCGYCGLALQTNEKPDANGRIRMPEHKPKGGVAFSSNNGKRCIGSGIPIQPSVSVRDETTYHFAPPQKEPKPIVTFLDRIVARKAAEAKAAKGKDAQKYKVVVQANNGKRFEVGEYDTEEQAEAVKSRLAKQYPQAKFMVSSRLAKTKDSTELAKMPLSKLEAMRRRYEELAKADNGSRLMLDRIKLELASRKAKGLDAWDPDTVGYWTGGTRRQEYSMGGYVEKTDKGQWIGYNKRGKASQAFIFPPSARAWVEHEAGARFAKAKDAMPKEWRAEDGSLYLVMGGRYVWAVWANKDATKSWHAEDELGNGARDFASKAEAKLYCEKMAAKTKSGSSAKDALDPMGTCSKCKRTGVRYDDSNWSLPHKVHFGPDAAQCKGGPVLVPKKAGG